MSIRSESKKRTKHRTQEDRTLGLWRTTSMPSSVRGARSCTPRERERLLALMDRVVVLSEARVMLDGGAQAEAARKYGRPELKARYLEALGGLHEEARIGFDVYRREAVPECRA